MPASNSPLAYGDARELLLRAVESERGLRLTLASPAAAASLRRRMNFVRAQDREASQKRLMPGDPLYGVSDFDMLEFAVIGAVLEVRKTSDLTNVQIEEL